MRNLGIAACVALAATTGLQAGEPRPQGSGLVVRGAAGLGIGGMDVAGESEQTPGFAGGVFLGASGRRIAFDFEVAFQPFHVDNPLGGEPFRATYLLPSLRVHGRHAYFRLGIGWVHTSWSGPKAFVSSESDPAFSLAAGYEFASPRGLPLSLEAYYRTGSDLDEFSTRLYGVQIVASWYATK